jgi:dTMP kinase
LRELLLHPPDGTAPVPRAELLLYAADRAQHVKTVLRPALERGDWVLCDRFTGSTWAYQGYGRGLDLGLIRDLEFLATGGLMADLTLWLDVSVAESIRRRGGQSSDRIEAGGWKFLFRVRRGFAAVAGQQSWTLIKAEHSEAAVTGDCCRAMVRHFGGRA